MSTTTVSVNKTDELHRLLDDARDLAATYEAHLALQRPVMDAAFAVRHYPLTGHYIDDTLSALIEAVRVYRDAIDTLDLPEHHDDLTAATAAEEHEWVIICPNGSDEPDVEECSNEHYARITFARHFQNEPGAFIARRSYVYTPADTEDQA